ncbi:DegV family protein [Kribbella solani]|uniref:DegV family protein with EDD domain n=1 Tax=Kribbella solani TaxID=236067 RepID=A0A841DS61_9ACTN|nr:DegV family protein [Kribbella solani]MBB5979560.1 DegV family protein with EDD domain [Kribbella solani]MDX2968673.1 DegV family protein [Kribbella solani]MDX3006675.1 DegV family protein [Kribbella solani]
MSGSVHVVTDSTAGLSTHEVLRHRLTVVPLQVVIGGTSYDDGATSADAVAEALKTFTPVSTSRPAPQTFADTYATCAANGATAVVSIHLSGDMSGTFEAAMIGAKDSPIPVRVVDSRSLGMGLGFPVLAAAAAAAAGADAETVEAAARARMKTVSTYFYVDTLEYLRRGGRIGAAQALFGTALAVKPLLTINGGRIVPLEKVRTSSRAIARLADITVQRAGDTPGQLAVHHLSNLEKAQTLADNLATRLPKADEIAVREVGAVIGAHVGPGLLAVVISPH